MNTNQSAEMSQKMRVLNPLDKSDEHLPSPDQNMMSTQRSNKGMQSRGKSSQQQNLNISGRGHDKYMTQLNHNQVHLPPMTPPDEQKKP